ncbi:MAG: hypothetical protein HYW23_04090 [Candidatus Aenigmarchaeota archaeon]|nr:hypothetical protein [Candidatus Aenigmarchaeota archaeon]
MKAQVLLLTAVIIIGALVALKAYSIISQISTERDILDVSLEDSVFANTNNEIKEIIQTSITNPQTILDHSIDFLNFTRTGSNRHSLDFSALYVGVLANSTNQTMNITIFNFLEKTNLNVTIKLNTSVVQTNSTLLNDSGIWINNFTFTNGQTYNLTVTLPTENYEENITVQTRNNKDTYTGFFDIRLISLRAVHVNKFQQNVKIS